MSDAPAGTERLVRRDGVELATEAFGDRGRPCVLLIMGAMASMLWWPEPLCRRLADAGFHVIRYDNRDTGRSTCCVPGQPDYTFDDMVDDVFRVLDAYGVEAAHLVGMSMGGAIAESLGGEFDAVAADQSFRSRRCVAHRFLLPTACSGNRYSESAPLSQPLFDQKRIFQS